MTVREFIEEYSKFERYKLVGARTGKQLCTSASTEKRRAMFLDGDVVSVYPDVMISNSRIIKVAEWAAPCLTIAVSGF